MAGINNIEFEQNVYLYKSNALIDTLMTRLFDTFHTPPEWANLQFSRPEKWYTTYCKGPLGVPKNAFGQI